MNYLGDEIKHKILSSSPATTVLLSAPVGSGKTTFCIRQLWLHCRVHRKKLLLVVNRSALRGQLRQEIFRQLNIEDIPLVDDKILEVDGLTVTSYQNLQVVFKNNLLSSSIKIGAIEAWRFDYVVADEIHYLFMDSLFSPETGYMKRFPTAFPNAVRIYISATLQPVRNLLLELEEVRDLYECCDERDRKFLPYRYEQTGIRAMIARDSGRSLKREVLEIQGADADYSYFIPMLYEEETEIDHLVKDRMSEGDTGKWLIFVASKKEGTELKKRLVKAGITAAFVTASGEDAQSPMEKDDKEEMSSILQKSKFSSQVLLATPVLDNGVSIIDRQVTHLVITGYELIQAVQQAGRIRVKGKKQKIELYICRHTAEYFNRCQYQLREKLRICRLFDSSNEEERNEYLMHKCDNLLFDVLSKDIGGNWHVNQLARPALEYFMSELEENKNLLREDPNGFVLKILDFFGLSYDVGGDLLEKRKHQAMGEFERFLDSYEGQVLSGEIWDEFKVELRRRYEEGTGIKLCSGRSDRVAGTSTVSKVLKQQGYSLISKSKTYKIQKED